MNLGLFTSKFCIKGACPLPAFRVGGAAYNVKKLAARDSHFFLNNFLIKNFGVFLHFGGFQAFGGVPGEDFDMQNPNLRSKMMENRPQR